MREAVIASTTQTSVGAQIPVTVLLEWEHSDVSRGLATLCIGGGQGTALVVER